MKKTIKRNTTKKFKAISNYNWNTTDTDEILRRQMRAESEKYQCLNQDRSRPYFSSFKVISLSSNKHYVVEIRSLEKRINSCECLDYKTNLLGTCKHIEATLARLKNKGSRKYQIAMQEGSERVEIFWSNTKNGSVLIQWPTKVTKAVKALLEPYFSSDGSLLDDAVETMEALSFELAERKRLAHRIRISKHLTYYLNNLKIQRQKQQAKKAFLEDVARGKSSMDIVKYPLYPYQQQGMLHLAFMERALLADEMGLGKTVQALAACELLKHRRSINRVLVVTTASLKSEWQEQIEKFTDSQSLVITGSRGSRLQQYQDNAMFYLVNYEQVISDLDEIRRFLAPDVVILDEAQRIKNWRTKTASAIKELKSRYAFVLTGTPVENRIDDIYSLIQFLDPHLFGPLFRFNRDFYQLDENGRPVGYKNLDELYHRLRDIMLCRKKCDVEAELPKRIINNFFVTMNDEQRIRYEEYQTRVARLMHKAKKTPLRKEDFDRLQKWLACMRMVCDTPYILDKNCKVSPKLDELKSILHERLEDPETKIIIFSEWERMLKLVAVQAESMNIKFAWHTGSVPQHKRRENINRFKKQPSCRLFLSTDSGSVGLNLQNANVVINLDLPWNPAKLEQRIARAWRKHQTRSVHVINLIAENSIEHRMLHLLNQKQLMSDSILSGDTEVTSMAMPSGRAAFMERMETLIDEDVLSDTCHSHEKNLSSQQLYDHLLTRFDENIRLLQRYNNSNTNKETFLMVTESNTMANDIEQFAIGQEISLEIIDPKTFSAIQRLIDNGILKFNSAGATIFDSQSSQDSLLIYKKKIVKAKQSLIQAERHNKLAKVLMQEGFDSEAIGSLKEALKLTLEAYNQIAKNNPSTRLEDLLVSKELCDKCNLTKHSSLFLSKLFNESDNQTNPDEFIHPMSHFFSKVSDLISKLEGELNA